ncbi:Ficolin-1 [Penaeus vannamei]|uniref:Ficolin-1 n=1 Tax=Penaeus vannamei TaxID=6689 RepID=A0A3R7PL32_PENVA|nr:Ficolin-1 [Penaeus vannamei]
MISIGSAQGAAIHAEDGSSLDFSKTDLQGNCCSDVRVTTSPDPSKPVSEEELILDSQRLPETPQQSTSAVHSDAGSTPGNTPTVDVTPKRFQSSESSSLQIQAKETTETSLHPQLVLTSTSRKASDDILQGAPTDNEAFGRVSPEVIRKGLQAASVDASRTRLYEPSEKTSQNPLQLKPYGDLQPTSSGVYQSSQNASDEHLHSLSHFVSQEPLMSESALRTVAHALPYNTTQVTSDDASQMVSDGSSVATSGTSHTSLDVTSNVALGISQVVAGNISQDTTGNVSQATTEGDLRMASESIYPVEYFPMIEPKNCLEALAVGYNVSGVYTIRPYDCCPERRVKVFCDMATEGGGWTVIQRRDQYPTQENFYRTWKEYVSGFGDLTQEFWLGLEHIHALSNQSVYEARFDLGDFEGQTRFAKYDIFTVGSADRFYHHLLGLFNENLVKGLAHKDSCLGISPYLSTRTFLSPLPGLPSDLISNLLKAPSVWNAYRLNWNELTDAAT